jgi:hypothetical protein
MTKLHAFAAAAVAIIAATAGYAAFVVAPAPAPLGTATRNRPVWTEVKWPFPIDQWGLGRAFRCKAADCGSEVTLYLRAKIGFCNCTTGVADDEHLDRIGDIDLVSAESAALGPGRSIAVRWMKGRSRAYAITGRGSSARSALSVAFNDRCDVIVATSAIGSDEPSKQAGAVLEFLNSDLVLHWAEKTLGL